MTHPRKFIEYYSNLQFPRPVLQDFIKTHLTFRIGIYLTFLEKENLLVVVSSLGFKVRQYHLTEEEILNKNPKFLIDVFYDGEQVDILTSYERAIQAAFNHIITPF